MAKDAEKRKPVSPEAKAKNLLNRFPIVDLSQAISLNDVARRSFLARFVETFTTLSYSPTRDAAKMIYGAQKPLFDTAPEPWSAISNALKATAHSKILDMNLDAAEHLFNLVRPKDYRATECEPQTLRIRLKQIVTIGLDFYITSGERLIFQFPYLRKEYLNDHALTVLGSIIHHSYAQGDFSDAEIEIADISCHPREKSRAPRIRSVLQEHILDREELNSQIEDVYDALREIAVRYPKPPGRDD